MMCGHRSRTSRRLLELVERLKAASPEEADQIKREIAEMLGPGVFYVRESRFELAEEREEVVGEVEEAVAEDGLEPVGEVEEVVEDDEYLGQRVVRRAFPEERPRRGGLPY
jgi:uncharacterized protein Yka (UPF0111/DUF47 family)